MYDRVSGHFLPGSRSGELSYLDKEEEEELVRWITGCAEVGCANNVREVKAVVSAIVLKKLDVLGICVTYGWWETFRRRHPELVLRNGESLLGYSGRK